MNSTRPIEPPRRVVAPLKRVFYTPAECAEVCACSQRAIDVAIRERKLVAHRVGKKYLVRPVDLQRWANSLPLVCGGE